jgi:hypothetical protein
VVQPVRQTQLAAHAPLGAARVSVWPQLGIAPGRVLRVFGMRRSGNHAVINWLARNAPGGKSVFFNNCAHGGNPFETFRSVEINGRRRPGGPGDAAEQFAKRAGNGATVMFSYEDVMPNTPRKRPLSAGVNEAEIDGDIVIARSFLNWSASLTKKIRPNPNYTPARRVGILMRALEVYGQMLKLAKGDAGQDVTVISYDAWFRSAKARAKTLQALGFDETDNSLGDVQPYGNGSSFQADAAAPEDLTPEQRWEQMREDGEYRVLLWIAAQDAEFCADLAAVYPEDAAQLSELAKTAPGGVA